MKLTKKELTKIISEVIDNHINEDYGWDIKRGKEQDALEDAIEMFGEKSILQQLVQAMGTSALSDNLSYIFRMNDYESPYLK